MSAAAAATTTAAPHDAVTMPPVSVVGPNAPMPPTVTAAFNHVCYLLNCKRDMELRHLEELTRQGSGETNSAQLELIRDRIESNREYMSYVHGIGQQLAYNDQSRQSHSSHSSQQQQQQRVSGAIGQFITITVCTSFAQALQKHNEYVVAPLRCWFLERLKGATATSKQQIHRFQRQFGGLNYFREFKLDAYPDETSGTTTDAVCRACGSRGVTSDDDCVCPRCGHVLYSDTLNCTTQAVSYADQSEGPMQPEEVATSGYRPTAHFMDRFRQCLGLQQKTIPTEIMDLVRRNRTARPHLCDEEISAEVVRTWLRDASKTKWYDDAPLIRSKLLNVPTLTVTAEQEDALREYFQQVNQYQKSLKNPPFIKYQYFAYKLCELLGYDDLLPHFSLVKDPSTLKRYDDFWKEVCEHFNWVPQPTGDWS